MKITKKELKSMIRGIIEESNNASDEFNKFMQQNAQDLITGEFHDEDSPYHIFNELDAEEYNESEDKEAYVKDMIDEWYATGFAEDIEDLEEEIPDSTTPDATTIAKFIKVLDEEVEDWI
jgi:hypothetical protein